MARPQKQPEERRDSWLSPVRVTAAEFAFVAQQAAAAGRDVSDYIRRRALGRRVTPARSIADDRLLMEMNRIGNNLNQIARSLNSDRPERVDLSDTLREFRACLAAVAGRVPDGP